MRVILSCGCGCAGLSCHIIKDINLSSLGLFVFLIHKSLQVCSLGVAESPVKTRWNNGKQLDQHWVTGPGLQAAVDEISAQNHPMILGPLQVIPIPKNIKPRKQLRFQHSLQSQFSWLTYNKEKNAMFCTCCIQLALLGIHSQRDATFLGKAHFRITFI